MTPPEETSRTVLNASLLNRCCRDILLVALGRATAMGSSGQNRGAHHFCTRLQTMMPMFAAMTPQTMMPTTSKAVWWPMNRSIGKDMVKLARDAYNAVRPQVGSGGCPA